MPHVTIYCIADYTLHCGQEPIQLAADLGVATINNTYVQLSIGPRIRVLTSNSQQSTSQTGLSAVNLRRLPSHHWTRKRRCLVRVFLFLRQPYPPRTATPVRDGQDRTCKSVAEHRRSSGIIWNEIINSDTNG